MSKLTNKIEAHDRTVFQVLNEKKYTVDYFQREYNWAEKHIEQLVSDLTTAFFQEYSSGDSREAGELYNNYYLGPFVVSEKSSQRSIIDGQQRLTSLTLMLIYLNNLQKALGIDETIEPMIFSELRGKKSFNIQVDERVHCLQELFENGEYQTRKTDDESTINMAERYHDIENAFPEDIKGNVLPFFLDWLKYNVILVEIIAYSDDNAYTIFETMNDRGLNLTPSEMLKGFILSRFTEPQTRQAANKIWKSAVQQLHRFEKTEDQRFFQAWFRSQYADTIRPGRAGSKNEDFEKIGTRFHSWVRDNQEKMGLESKTDFQSFVNDDFRFFHTAYLRILKAERTFCAELEHVYYIYRWGIASSLSYPLLLAPLTLSDSDALVAQKMNLVAKYIETFVVRRAVNFRKFASSSIRYTMYTLVKEIRNKPLPELSEILSNRLAEMDETLDGLRNFRMHRQNKRFVKFFLARITGFIENEAGIGNGFVTFYQNPGGQPFQIEHIWANHFQNHSDEFQQKHDFDTYRNRIGDLVLLPRGTNQSYGAKAYEEKLTHYIKENLLVKSLCPAAYQNNPNFLHMKERLGLSFEPHTSFKKADIDKRQSLYLEISKLLWPTQLS